MQKRVTAQKTRPANCRDPELSQQKVRTGNRRRHRVGFFDKAPRNRMPHRARPRLRYPAQLPKCQRHPLEIVRSECQCQSRREHRAREAKRKIRTGQIARRQSPSRSAKHRQRTVITEVPLRGWGVRRIQEHAPHADDRCEKHNSKVAALPAFEVHTRRSLALAESPTTHLAIVQCIEDPFDNPPRASKGSSFEPPSVAGLLP